MKTIAVAIAVFNGEKYIVQQLRSIVGQTRRPDKIYISDDHSTDRTVMYAENVLRASGIEYVIVKNRMDNTGVNNNFENALKMITEDIVFISDQDDIWDCKKIEKMSRCLQHNSGMFLCNAQYLKNNKRIKKQIFDAINYKPTVSTSNLADKETYIRECIKRPLASGMSMAVSREIIQAAIPFPEYMFYDEWINWNAIMLGNIYVTNECLVYYRQHDANVVGGRRRYNWSRLKHKVKDNQLEIQREQNGIQTLLEMNRKSEVLSENNKKLLYKKENFMKNRFDAVTNNSFRLYIKNLLYYKNKCTSDILYRKQQAAKDFLSIVIRYS